MTIWVLFVWVAAISEHEPATTMYRETMGECIEIANTFVDDFPEEEVIWECRGAGLQLHQGHVTNRPNALEEM